MAADTEGARARLLPAFGEPISHVVAASSSLIANVPSLMAGDGAGRSDMAAPGVRSPSMMLACLDCQFGLAGSPCPGPGRDGARRKTVPLGASASRRMRVPMAIAG